MRGHDVDDGVPADRRPMELSTASMDASFPMLPPPEPPKIPPRRSRIGEAAGACRVDTLRGASPYSPATARRWRWRGESVSLASSGGRGPIFGHVELAVSLPEEAGPPPSAPGCGRGTLHLRSAGGRQRPPDHRYIGPGVLAVQARHR